nr:lp_hng_hel_AbrB: transcriptional regulator, AbrB [uncultured bacterium]
MIAFSEILNYSYSDMSFLKQVDPRGNVVLPKEIREGVELVEIERRADGVIELRPKVAVDASQAWFWTDGWQARERIADEQIAAGKVKRFDNVDALLDDLNG